MFPTIITALCVVITCCSARDRFDAFVIGNNTCYMAQGYYPKEDLLNILPDPKRMSIPSDATMRKYYSDITPIKDMHPFLLSFCHGANISDTMTHKVIPEQEELMFVFPIMYQLDKTHPQHLCSFIPVLYLNSTEGVVGGLDYGLRKEYRGDMVVQQTVTSKSWHVGDTIDATFEQQAVESNAASFFTQSFTNPFVTVSWPPLERHVFYQAKVHAVTLRNATGSFQWNYKGTEVENKAEDIWSVYSRYWFTMSWPMNYTEYFES